jgi:hypothetical protein
MKHLITVLVHKVNALRCTTHFSEGWLHRWRRLRQFYSTEAALLSQVVVFEFLAVSANVVWLCLAR